VLAAALAPGPAARAQAAPACSFQLGFAALTAALHRRVGACLDDERHDAGSGDALQHTTGGLLVWRKADNWTAFTDGYRTWVAGPAGVQERLSTQRFAWEADPEGLPVVGVITAPAGVVALGGGLERADYPTLGLRVVYPAATVAAAYGKSLGQLEQEWIAFLTDRTRSQPLAFDPVTYFAALDRLHHDDVRLFALAAQHDVRLDGPAYRAVDAARLAVGRHDAVAAQRQFQLAEAALA
jgi:hypothetical protein